MRYATAVFIGRMQPLHLAHKASIEKALELADNVLVLVGSAFTFLSPKNPWSFEDRKEMILSTFPEERDRITVLPICDYSNDDAWTAAVQQVISQHTNASDSNICLVGHKKDRTSYYIDMFPQWDFVEAMDKTIPMDATAIREAIFEYKFGEPGCVEKAGIWRGQVPHGVIGFIEKWMTTLAFGMRKEEYDYYKDYDPKKFPVTMQTVDAVVVCAGHILMVRRKFAPGKGSWALPGGFLDQRERIKDGIIRELKEETGIKVSKEKLYDRLSAIQFFDNPNRSLRGRVITHAGLIRLELDPKTRRLPEVRAADDADAAMWVSLQDLASRRNNIFEDHFDIIFNLLSLS
jgi:bifunctional NMN adenylyltransferase/nudix hydrolase